MPRRDRHIRLTEDPDVNRWYESFDSQKTAKDRLRQLGLFCERVGTTPKGYVKLSAKAYTDMIQDYCVKWAGETVKKAVVSWLGHWGKKLQRKVNESVFREVRSMYDRSSPERRKGALLLMVDSESTSPRCFHFSPP